MPGFSGFGMGLAFRLVSSLAVGKDWSMPVSQPRSHNSYFALFAGTDVNVYEAVPITQQGIVSDATVGYSTFRGMELSESQYTAAYATNYDQRTICAVVTFDKDGSKKSASTTTIAIDSIGSDSISLSYSTPAGNKPSTNGNWIAVWRNPFSPSNGPLVTKSLSSDSNAGSVTINDFEMTSGTSYTIGYIALFLLDEERYAPRNRLLIRE